MTPRCTRQHFGRTLRRLRTARCLSQCELAAAVGVHPTKMPGYEAGRNLPNPGTIAALAAALGVPAADLLRERARALGCTEVPPPGPADAISRAVRRASRHWPPFTLLPPGAEA